MSLCWRRSEGIRRMFRVYYIKEKAREARLRYFGHAKRRDEEEPVKKAMSIPVTRRRNVDRQRIKWKDLLKRDENKLGLQEEDAMNRNKRQKSTLLANLTTQYRMKKKKRRIGPLYLCAILKSIVIFVSFIVSEGVLLLRT